MASIKRQERKSGKIVYRIQVTVGYDMSGKRKDKVKIYEVNQNATPKQQEKEALQYALKLEQQIKNGENFDGEEMTFEEFSEKWKADIKDSIAYSTYTSYLMILNNRLLPYFGHFKVARIKTPHVEAFYKTLLDEYANGSIVKVANVLSGMFRTAVRWQMIEVNPCAAAKVPKHKDEDNELKYYTPQQSLMFLRSLDLTFDTVIRGHQRIDDTGKPYLVADYTESHSLPLQLKVFYTLSLYCGFRKGETLALHWSDIDFEKKTISITKSVGKTEDGVELKKPKTATSVRTVSFPDAILPLLKQYKKEYTTYRFELGTAWQGDGNLFIQADGKLMGRSTPYQSFKRHLKRYNDWVRENPTEAKKQGFEALPVIPLHGLRHSCATLLNYLEITLVDISKILGHAKTSTTMDIYAHSFEEQNIEAANRINQFVMNNQLMHA